MYGPAKRSGIIGRRRRLIEVAFPLEEVSEHSAHEKNVKQGHINMLHVWWARRPLAACRAFIYASLVDDPGNDQERDGLLKEVADLASWNAVRHPQEVVRPRDKGGSGLTGAELLKRARQRILDSNGGKPPRLLDPFAGGGAIPLEALRLGCEVEASDLNPVAVLILKGTVEYPQKYGQPDSRPVPEYIREAARSSQSTFKEGDLQAAYRKNPLAADVRYWGAWMLERARKELAQFYPPDPDGSVPVAYLWSRTVPCPNCHADMPLIRQYWLARKDKKKVALKPVLDRADNRVDFEVMEGEDVTGDPTQATTSHGDTRCLLCGQVVKAEYVRQAGRDGKLSSMLTAVVLESNSTGGKIYRPDGLEDRARYDAARQRLQEVEAAFEGELSPVPDEPINPDTLGLRVDSFGLDHWAKLFNARQLLALTTFAGLVTEAHARMLSSGLDDEYAAAVSTYLSFVLDRFANTNSTLARLMSAGGRGIVGTFARQALPMVWDYAEANPFGTSASWASATDAILAVFEGAVRPCLGGRAATVSQADARRGSEGGSVSVVITDPPYYDAIDYAGLSDFFYVWLKRSIGCLHPELLALPLTPKKEQAIVASETGNAAARERYLGIMTAAFDRMATTVGPDGLLGIVFAHADPDAWSTLIEGLLHVGLIPDASWPVDTELGNKVSAAERANLKTSVWMACRPRSDGNGDAFLGDVMQEMKPVIRDCLLYFWSKGIRGADFFISAIGPALSVFGRHKHVLRPDGTEVTVRDFLDLVRKESTLVALEQVLQGADLGAVDPATRQYVTWVWSYSRAPLDAGDAIALCLATGADYAEVARPHSIGVESKEKSKKLVKLRTIKERGQQDEHLGLDSPAKPAPLIDQLQRAAWLWGLNKPDEIAKYRASLGESRWAALRTLGQAVADCLPDGDEDRRLINGLLGSSVMGVNPSAAVLNHQQPTKPRLPGLD